VGLTNKCQLIKKENQYTMDKALLEQTIQLQFIELEDYKKREENLARMNEAILSVLNDFSSTNKPNVLDVYDD